jgi:DNA-binding transcriptional regulator PaaX
MKQSTQKVLLALYPAAEQSALVSLSAEQLRACVGDLSPSGFRSLLYAAEKNGYLARENIGSQSYFVLRDIGRRKVEVAFPAFSPRFERWSGEWSCMVFLEAPAGDPQFRYLRRLLLEKGALGLSRGVYLSAGEFDQRVMSEVEALYAQSLAIFTIGKWQLGSERPIVIDSMGLDDIAAGYSGVSTEIKQLLRQNRSESKLNDQSKAAYYTLFDRFLSLLQTDPGFTTRYFPGLESPTQLLAQLQQLFRL